ncbi:hypothetical protein C3B47_07820 [Flavobacterium columnare]|uniref:DUF1697 domain-containing protein n=1 Tax=Flavobacterium columnare TaxID=996 RepID=UPI000D1B1602|nr:DUF1697 domain-containing protein [Flavobacterium columnare]MBF6652801.1 hypothetical protein [Flavobacterium columnare]MBF6655750.1 hypothetical protein [Flavobacterium columnare]MBF6658604.1 hypothetical protein [Flavobacterium columnare]PTD15000.1 DUF1697 domain-containing protein [Flavobacterium columnare]
MKKHLALLRGINVSGHNMIKMDDLKVLLERMGFQNVVTYIQSGNVFFECEETNGPSVGFKIKQEIFKEWGYEVPVMVLGKEDLEGALSNNPYLKEKEADPSKIYFAFLNKELNESAIHDLKISQVKPDEATVDKNRIYLKYINGAGKTRMDNKYIEKKLNVLSTIRNFNTVTKLLEMF